MNEGTVSRTSTSLLRRAQADDADAWQELVTTYSRSIYRWSRRGGLQPADASNVVQEVLRSVARKLPDFRRERKSDTFRGWLRRITQNKLNDFYRNCSKQVDKPAGGTDAHQRLERFRDGNRQIREAEHSNSNGSLEELKNPLVLRVRSEFSDRDWRFFWRVVVDGQSAVEVGSEFNVTANAVRLVKMRILRRLREEFSKQT